MALVRGGDGTGPRRGWHLPRRDALHLRLRGDDLRLRIASRSATRHCGGHRDVATDDVAPRNTTAERATDDAQHATCDRGREASHARPRRRWPSSECGRRSPPFRCHKSDSHLAGIPTWLLFPLSRQSPPFRCHKSDSHLAGIPTWLLFPLSRRSPPSGCHQRPWARRRCRGEPSPGGGRGVVSTIGPSPATSAPGLGPPLHTSAPGRSPASPHLRRDWAHPRPHLRRDWAHLIHELRRRGQVRLVLHEDRELLGLADGAVAQVHLRAIRREAGGEPTAGFRGEPFGGTGVSPLWGRGVNLRANRRGPACGCVRESASPVSPGADVDRGEPSPGADVDRGGPKSRRRPCPGADVGGMSPVPVQMREVSPVPAQMWVG